MVAVLQCWAFFNIWDQQMSFLYSRFSVAIDSFLVSLFFLVCLTLFQFLLYCSVRYACFFCLISFYVLTCVKLSCPIKCISFYTVSLPVQYSHQSVAYIFIKGYSYSYFQFLYFFMCILPYVVLYLELL